jgi:replicative DNA helicase
LTLGVTSATALETAAQARKGGGLSGIATHFIEIDRKMGGLQPSDLIVVAGRPSSGKTSLGTNIAFNVARARALSLAQMSDLLPDDPRHGGASVVFFSLEMSAEQLSTRIMSERTGIGEDPPWLHHGRRACPACRGAEGNRVGPALHRPDRGTEFCGKPGAHEYELYLAVEPRASY